MIKKSTTMTISFPNFLTCSVLKDILQHFKFVNWWIRGFVFLMSRRGYWIVYRHYLITFYISAIAFVVRPKLGGKTQYFLSNPKYLNSNAWNIVWKEPFVKQTGNNFNKSLLNGFALYGTIIIMYGQKRSVKHWHVSWIVISASIKNQQSSWLAK